MNISYIKSVSHISMLEVMECFDLVRKRGDVFVVKVDGERDSDQYTVFINRIGKAPAMLRADGDNLEGLVLDVTKKYLAEEAL